MNLFESLSFKYFKFGLVLLFFLSIFVVFFLSYNMISNIFDVMRILAAGIYLGVSGVIIFYLTNMIYISKSLNMKRFQVINMAWGIISFAFIILIAFMILVEPFRALNFGYSILMFGFLLIYNTIYINGEYILCYFGIIELRLVRKIEVRKTIFGRYSILVFIEERERGIGFYINRKKAKEFVDNILSYSDEIVYEGIRHEDLT